MIKIFVINLKRSKSRRESIIAQMQKFGLKFEFIEAVDGNNLTLQQLSRVNRLKASFRLGRKMTKREIGCALSHSNIYEKIIKQNISQAIILEDDAELTQQFADFVKQKTYLKIAKDFIFLYSGWLYYKAYFKFSEDITLYESYVNPTVAVAYYINNKMAKKLYEHTKIIQYVSDYPVLLSSIGSVAIIKPNIVKTGDFESTIDWDNYIARILNAIRNKLFIGYIFNRKNYNSIWDYINMVYFKKNKYKD